MARRHRTRRRSAWSRARTRRHWPRRTVDSGRRPSWALSRRAVYARMPVAWPRRHRARRTLHSGPRCGALAWRTLHARPRRRTRRRWIRTHCWASARPRTAAPGRGAGIRHRRGRKHEQREHCGYELFHHFRSFHNFTDFSFFTVIRRVAAAHYYFLAYRSRRGYAFQCLRNGVFSGGAFGVCRGELLEVREIRGRLAARYPDEHRHALPVK